MDAVAAASLARLRPGSPREEMIPVAHLLFLLPVADCSSFIRPRAHGKSRFAARKERFAHHFAFTLPLVLTHLLLSPSNRARDEPAPRPPPRLLIKHRAPLLFPFAFSSSFILSVLIVKILLRISRPPDPIALCTSGLSSSVYCRSVIAADPQPRHCSGTEIDPGPAEFAIATALRSHSRLLILPVCSRFTSVRLQVPSSKARTTATSFCFVPSLFANSRVSLCLWLQPEKARHRAVTTTTLLG